MATPQARGLVALRLCLGVFFVYEALSKVGWFLDSGPLVKQLEGWLASAGPWNRWYLQIICLPGAPIFARVVPIAEVSTGIALLLGAYVRPVSVLAILMVLNFHFASGQLFRYPSIMNNGYFLPVVGGLLALALGAVSLPLSLMKK
jgi:uncharacterized membrane protein YphA (DoxX/SURF4 family)